MQNCFVENFNGSLRDECMNEKLFSSTGPQIHQELEGEPQQTQATFIAGNITPIEYVVKMALRKQAA